MGLQEIQSNLLKQPPLWGNHLSKTTNAESIPKQELLYKMPTCLTWLATTFLSPKWKIDLSKTAIAKLSPAEKWEAMHKK